jgi:C4-dicarboxylate-specific signal transduction histidine kinase
MMAAACLTLAAMHLVIWLRQSARMEHLYFSILAVCVAVNAAAELGMMRAATAEQFGLLQRWLHVAIFFACVSVVGFVHASFGTARMWLGWSVCGLRLVSLVLNFHSDVSLNYTHITGLKRVEVIGGDVIAVAEGVFNPWTRLGQASLALLVIFVLDAAIALWRRGDDVERQRAALIGGALVVFILVGVTHHGLIVQGMVASLPITTAMFFGVVVAMGYELGSGVVREAQLSVRLQQQETQLRATEQRMDLAASAADLSLWEWDVRRDEVWMTDRGRYLFGSEEHEPIDLARLLGRVHREDREHVRRSIDDALRGGGEYDREFRIELAAGGSRWISTRGRVEFASPGLATLMRGVALDITARKEAEQHARMLEAEAAKRRDELAHLSRVAMLGELSGSIAHELNQPLTAILSNAQAAKRFLARGMGNVDELREILTDIVEDDKRAGEVIRRLRALHRKDAVRHQPLDVNEVVSDVMRLMRSDLLNRRVNAILRLAPELPQVHADRVLLQQVLLNLIVNGCEAMDGCTGPRELTVQTRREEDGSVGVSVADRGKGIAQSDLVRIFQPFVTTKPQGLGLGLAVCRTIIDAHGGELWAENHLSGAVLRFKLPALQDAA